jgi:hypothetical protein
MSIPPSPFKREIGCEDALFSEGSETTFSPSLATAKPDMLEHNKLKKTTPTISFFNYIHLFICSVGPPYLSIIY